MESLKWRPKYSEASFQYQYAQKEIIYVCPHCEHVMDKVASIPFRCAKCQRELPNLASLLPEANQDLRVKFFARGAL